MTPEIVLKFWFEDAGPEHWFKQSDAFDKDVQDKFETAAKKAASDLASGGPHPWEAEAQSALALILMLDQFPRNMYRNTPQAFAWDARAMGVAGRMIEAGFDFEISEDIRSFVYLPFMHCETLDAQNRCVDLCTNRLKNQNTLKHAKEHRLLIEQFGRFPHRNAILGRTSQRDEIEFLEAGGYSP